MPHAVRIHGPGGSEVLQWEHAGARAPGPGAIRLKQSAVGLNHIDVYRRTGAWPLRFTPGAEGAGTVEAVGFGMVKTHVNQAYALQDAARAHRHLEARTTTGSMVLTV